MNSDCKDSLRLIGQQLDWLIFPRVKNGGIVVPSEPAIHFQPLGKEKNYESKRERRSTTEPWARADRWQRAASEFRASGGSRTASNTTSFLGSIGRHVYKAEELTAVCKAYPGTRIWEQGENFWLHVESSLLPGLQHKASFLVLISVTHQTVRSWGFWDSCAVGVTWIGPRHTNFPDGSICAFEPKDGTWQFGDSLVKLLDIYSAWALRHLHCEIFGRWPGPQSVALPFERMMELRDDELCGCGHLQKRYADCCKPTDMKRNRIAEAVLFGIFSAWSVRCPPVPIIEFMLLRSYPPAVSDIFR